MTTERVVRHSTPNYSRGSVVTEVNAAALTSVRTTAWTTQVIHTFTATWVSAGERYKFFNNVESDGSTGGEIRLSSSRTGGSSNGQNTDWTTLLSAQGVNTLDATEYDSITTSYTQWFQATGSGAYSLNDWTVNYKKNADGSVITIQSIYNDDHVATGLGPDEVDGTLTSNIDEQIDDALTSPTYATTVALSAGS